MPKVTTQFGDKKLSVWITKEQLEALKKATGKDSAYSAVKVAISAGYEHIMKCSTVPDIDNLVRQVQEMPDNEVDKKFKKLRMHGRHNVQNLNEELVHYAASSSDYTLYELIQVALMWAKKISKVANVSFEEALRYRMLGDTRDVQKAVGYYSKRLARDIGVFRSIVDRYVESDDRPRPELEDIATRLLQQKREERKLKEGKNAG
jgi:hypothetical protein